MIDVTSSAQTIDNIARLLRDRATTLERIAEKMRVEQDIAYASEAVNEMVNLLANARLDLLISRPLNALKGYVEDQQKHQ